ncbi:Protein-L-isoaspartate O-methyltransferase [invertebrate metagenome]|uniref:Protein-L-isoaspartate O-methyltransferase n=1 Tax=invertebrate metagenome TaxID=1711999 RepID=A0A2H9T6X4_9ZZZZ
MLPLKHFLNPLRICCQAYWSGWRDTASVIIRYYRTHPFFASFCWLKLAYMIDTPWLVARRYQNKTDPYAYGETPLMSLKTIMEAANLTTEDHVAELGSGSGYTALWLGSIARCKVTAIEKIPLFCWRLQRTVKRFRLESVHVHCKDYLSADLSGVTLVYACACNLSNDRIQQLAHKLITLPAGTRVITVSYPLHALHPHKIFTAFRQLPIQFHWGTCQVFIQTITEIPAKQ